MGSGSRRSAPAAVSDPEEPRTKAGDHATGAAVATPPAASASRFSRWHADINHAADKFFYRLGRRIAVRPKTVVFLALACVVLCCTGFLNFRTESDARDLWVPIDTVTEANEDLVSTYYEEDADWALLILEHPDAGGSVLTKEAMDIFWELDAKILEVEAEGGETYEDVCVMDLVEPVCAQPSRGVSRFWGDSYENYEATVFDDADVLAAIDVDVFPDGSPVSLEAIFGNSLTYDGSTGAVTGARAMMQSYRVEIDGDLSMEWELAVQDFMEFEAESVEAQGLNVVYSTNRSMDDALSESVSGEIILFFATYVVMIICVMICVGRCRQGAVERRSWLGLAGVGIVFVSGIAAYGVCSGFGVPFTSLAQLLPFILIGIGVDDMFVVLASLDHTNVGLPVEERLGLALERCGGSITYTSFTNFSAFLLGSITSLPAVEFFCSYAATAILFVFVLQVTVFPAMLAMDLNRQRAGRMDWCCCCRPRGSSTPKRGVILPRQPVSEEAAAARDHEMQQRRMNSLVRGHYPQLSGAEDGHAKFLSSGSNKAIAASVGDTADASTGETRDREGHHSRQNSIASGYRRQASGEEQLQEYINPLASTSYRAASFAAERSGGAGGQGGNAKGLADRERHLTGLGRWMRDKFAPRLLSATGKTLVILVTGGLFLAGIYGVTKVSQGFDRLDIVPDDHYVRDFYELARSYDLAPDTSFVGMEVYHQDVDYENVTVQALIQATDDLMVEQTYFTGPVDSWLTSFGSWAASNSDYSANTDMVYGKVVYADNSTFRTALGDFLADVDNARFVEDVIFNDEGDIEMSRTNMFLVSLTDTDSSIKALEESRSTLERSPLEPTPFAVSGVFIFTEQYLVIYGELVMNFILALVAVALLSLIVLGRVGVVALICSTVFIIDVELLGFVYYWGLEVNPITVIELIMAVGLVVDYMVHVVHYYLHQDASIAKNLRIGRALGEIGPSVMIGAGTTFLGIMPMAFANNVIFRVFFKMFLVIILSGFFHGVIFIPVALSLLSEPAHPKIEAREIPSETKEVRNDPGSDKRIAYAGVPDVDDDEEGKNEDEGYVHTAEHRNTSTATDNIPDRDRDHTQSGQAQFSITGNGASSIGGGPQPQSHNADTAAASATNSPEGSSRATVVQVEGGDGLDGFDRVGGGNGGISDLDAVDVEPGSGLGTPGSKSNIDSSRSRSEIGGVGSNRKDSTDRDGTVDPNLSTSVAAGAGAQGSSASGVGT